MTGQSVVEEVKERIDIVEFISRYVPLKKSGNTYKANCPFHNERTPSFVVYPNGYWRCYGACGVGGDVYNFLMRQENLDFREALEVLANQVGVDLSQNVNSQAQQQRNSLYTINEAAAAYFHEVLNNHPAAQAARDYLAGRQIDAETSTRFQLGFALQSWDSLRNYLDEQGYSIEDQLTAGLLKRHTERDSTYDAFRNRLMIPIRDRQGRIIGFGGRVLDDSQPKYLNTAETELFHKSRVVYGLDMATKAIRAADQVVIAEGYMDVIAAHQHGFANVVACMGTSLTAEQLQQLQRYTRNFTLALDADAAGQQATVRGLNQARQALSRSSKPTLTPTGIRMEQRLSANLTIVAMPEGRDPDDVIRQSADEWQRLVAQAKPLVDFYFDIVAGQYDLETPNGKGLAVTELSPLIAELGDEIEREHYIQRLSRMVRIDEMTIAARVQAAGKTQAVAKGSEQTKARLRPKGFAGQPRLGSDNGQSNPVAPMVPDEPPPHLYDDAGYPSDAVFGADEWGLPPAAPTPSKPAAPGTAPPISCDLPGKDQEDYLLAALLQEPDILVWLAGMTDQLEIAPLRVDDLESVENQEIFRSLKRFITSDEPWDVELFQEALTGHLHGRLGDLMVYSMQLPQRGIRELRTDIIKVLLRMRIQHLKADSVRIKYLLDEAHRDGDDELARSFSSSNNHNLRDRFHLERTLASLSQVAIIRDQTDQGIKIM